MKIIEIRTQLPKDIQAIYVYWGIGIGFTDGLGFFDFAVR
jgi:hypothetical protein